MTTKLNPTSVPLEIERKFLSKDDSWKDCLFTNVYEIEQGWIDGFGRVRLKYEKGQPNKAFHTVKTSLAGLESAADGQPVVRQEEESEMDFKMAKEKIAGCSQTIKKTRHVVAFEGHNFEIDVFNNLNFELTLIEVELKSIEEKVTLPSWVGKEVSSDNFYANSSLVSHTQHNVRPTP